MNHRNFLILFVALMLVAITAPSEAGLLGRRSKCCKPATCCKPVTCCEPVTTCCEPVSCCEPVGCSASVATCDSCSGAPVASVEGEVVAWEPTVADGVEVGVEVGVEEAAPEVPAPAAPVAPEAPVAPAAPVAPEAPAAPAVVAPDAGAAIKNESPSVATIVELVPGV